MNADSDDAYLRSVAGSPGLTAEQIAALRALDHGSLPVVWAGAADALLDLVPDVQRERLLAIYEPETAEAWLCGVGTDGVRPLDLLRRGEIERFKEQLAAVEQTARGS